MALRKLKNDTIVSVGVFTRFFCCSFSCLVRYVHSACTLLGAGFLLMGVFWVFLDLSERKHIECHSISSTTPFKLTHTSK